MRKIKLNRIICILLLVLSAAAVQAIDLTIVGPPKAVLQMWEGGEVVIDPSGKYVIHDLEPGDVVIFTAVVPGRLVSDYAVEMGELSKTYRIDPDPTGVIAGELKFADAGFCPGLGLELYFIPHSAYLSIDLYQSFLPLASIFTGPQELSTRYIMPMLGAGAYVLPFDSLIRLNFGASVGGMFGNELPHPLFSAEISAGVEFKFFEHYILFAEINPRIMSPVRDASDGWTGWDNYRDIFGASRSDYVFNLGSWGMMGFPSTIFGFKYKY